jgi:hypothetical protein
MKKQGRMKQSRDMPDVANRFQNGKYHSFDLVPKIGESQQLQLHRINDDLLELIYGEQQKKNSSKQNIWQDDIDTDPYQKKARDILQYDQRDLRQFIAIKSDDPILQAHSELSSKFRKNHSPTVHLKIPTRYLKHRINRWRFNFENIFSSPEGQTVKMVRPIVKKESRTRIIASKTSKVESKDHILDTETPLRGTLQFSIKDANLANIDILGMINLCRCQFEPF